MHTARALIDSAKTRPYRASRISNLDTQPSEDWFVCSTTPRGRQIWYCRFGVTGLFPRLYGPFSSKRVAVRFLDAAISTLSESLAEIDAARDEHSCEGQVQKLHWGPLIEHLLLNPHPSQPSKKGR